MKLSKRHFWEWFKRHNHEYITLNKKSKKESAYWLNELNAHLRAYFKFFGYWLIVPHEGLCSLAVTVHGKSQHFRKVDAFIAAAPEIAGWEINALVGPQPIDFLLEESIQETGIDPREFYFSIEENDEYEIDIIIYHPLCTRENEHLYSGMAKAAVYNLVGERSFATDISLGPVINLSYADTDDLMKLEELPSCIGLRSSSSMTVDARGTLLIGNW